MLDRHFIVETRPVANAANVVIWKNYRISVLQDRLFRVERSDTLRFRDAATQSIWYRDMPAQAYTLVKAEDSLTIRTGACELVIKLDRASSFVLLDGREIPLDNAGNLGGTYRTLDMFDGKEILARPHIPVSGKVNLGVGVCSRTGVAVIDDSASLTIGEDGVIRTERADGMDEYVFVYGKDYRAALRALYAITGDVPILPRYALGNWWSRYHKYTDKEYLRVVHAFAEREIPLTVATIDMDWHYSDPPDIEKRFRIRELNRTDESYYGTAWGWTGYTWNEDYFPDYKKTLRQLSDMRLKVTLNLHPAEGVAWWESPYEEMAKAMGKDPKTCEYIPFQIADSTFVNAYFSVLHKPYECDGVEFWWIDWQQGTGSDMEGLDPLWALNHFHYLDHAKNHDRALILSRYAGVGSHRYPIGFSGDTLINWDVLAYLPYFTATASNIGYTWWSHDIGGHALGTMDEELYARFVQYGVFSPINRLHCTNDETMTKEPWYYGAAGLVAEKYLKFRHKLIPYLYTESYATHKRGRALVEPIYYEHDGEEAYRYEREYFFGESLLVVPIVSPADSNGYACVKAWLPQGKWTDIFTGFTYETGVNGKEITLARKLDEYPVFARAGAFLPLSADKGNGCGYPEKLEVWAYSGNGSYTLYEDGAYTTFTQTSELGIDTITIRCYGATDALPKTRTVALRCKNITEGSVRLFVDGVERMVEDEYAACVSVTIPVESEKTYRVEVRYTPLTVEEKRVKHALRVLMGAEGDNAEKYKVYLALLKEPTLDSYLRLIEIVPFADGVKLRLKEIL